MWRPRYTNLIRYEAARNEPDEHARAELLRLALTEDATHREGEDRVAGATAIGARLGERLAADPGVAWRLFDRELRGGCIHFRWRATVPHRTGGSGRGLARLGADGRLRGVELTETPEDEQPTRNVPARLRTWVTARPLESLALVAAFLYALLRLPLDKFYGELGTTPDEAGFADAESLLRQSIDAFGAYALLLLLALAFYFGPLFAVARFWYTGTLTGRTALRWLGLLLIPVVFLAVLVALLAAVAGEVGEAAPALLALAFAAALLAAAYASPWLVSRGQPAARRVATRRVAAGGGALIAVGLGVAVVAGPVLLRSSAAEDASAVRAGRAVADEAWVTWTARPVDVTWKAPPASRARLPGCDRLTYLGESEGHVVLYDASAGGRAIRVPAADVVLTFPARCPRSA